MYETAGERTHFKKKSMLFVIQHFKNMIITMK